MSAQADAIEVDLPARTGGVLDPQGRRQRGRLRVAQPGHPHRRRARAGVPQPRACSRSAPAWTPGPSRWAGRCTAPSSRLGRAAAAGRDGYASPGAELRRVDGHVTDRPGLGLLVLVADCLPVALAAPGRVAMLHCGWRGLAGGIVGARARCFDEPPAAAVGPGIGQVLLRGRRGGARGVLRPGWRGRRPHARPARGGRGQARARAGSPESSTWTCAPRAALTCSSPTAATAA